MPDDDYVRIRRDAWEAVLSRLDALERPMADARSGDVAVASPGPAGTDSAPVRAPEPESCSATGLDTVDAPRISRRRALGGVAAAGVAAIAAGAAGTEPAAASDGQSIVIGSNSNLGTNNTGLAVTGTGATYGFGVTDNGLAEYVGNAAILGHAKGQNFDVAVHGLHTTNGFGVWGESDVGDGVFGVSNSGVGVHAISVSPDGLALYVEDSGGTTAARIASQLNHISFVTSTNTEPPDRSTTTTPTNTLTASDSGALWYCTKVGAPGTWRKITGPGTAGALHVLPAPVRIYDSRPSTTPSQGPKTPLAANTARTLDLTVNSSTVPKGATAALVTCLLVNATAGSGNFTIWSNAAAKPQSNTLVWGPAGGRFTATAMTALDPNAKVKVQANLSTDLVIDVVGYYR